MKRVETAQYTDKLLSYTWIIRGYTERGNHFPKNEMTDASIQKIKILKDYISVNGKFKNSKDLVNQHLLDFCRYQSYVNFFNRIGISIYDYVKKVEDIIDEELKKIKKQTMSIIQFSKKIGVSEAKIYQYFRENHLDLKEYFIRHKNFN